MIYRLLGGVMVHWGLKSPKGMKRNDTHIDSNVQNRQVDN